MPQKTSHDPFPGIYEASNSAEKRREESADRRAGKFSKLIRAYAPYAVLIVAVLLAYSNVYHNEFLHDDPVLIRDNKFLTSWHYIGTLFVTHTAQGHDSHDPFYRPLMTLLYLFIYQTAGPSTLAFHLLNVTLHALNACLLYTLGVRLGFRRIGTFLAALLWALHPVQTEAVTYMSGTAEPLCGMLFLLDILVLTGDFSRRNILLACILFVLALLTKETAVVFPLLAMGLLFYRSENRWSFKTYLKTWPFWLLVVLYLVARSTVLNFNGFFGYYDTALTADITIWDRFCSFLATLPTYLRLLIWPTGLHFMRYFPLYRSLWMPQVMAGLVILAAAFTNIVWKPSRRATPLAWGILWAAAVHIPASGILVLNDAVITEHWLYLPMMGLSLGLGESLAQMSGHVGTLRFRPVLAGSAVLIAGLSGVMTFEQNKVWRDRITFDTHIIDCGEDTARTRTNLGTAYGEKGELTQAIRQFRLALALDNNYELAHFNLGAALINDAQTSYMLKITAAPPDLSSPGFSEGLEHVQRAFELNPDDYRACDALAYVYAHLGDQTKALEYQAKAAAIRKKLGID